MYSSSLFSTNPLNSVVACIKAISCAPILILDPTKVLSIFPLKFNNAGLTKHSLKFNSFPHMSQLQFRIAMGTSTSLRSRFSNSNPLLGSHGALLRKANNICLLPCAPKSCQLVKMLKTFGAFNMDS